MLGYYQRDNKTARERELEEELENQRYEDEQRREREYQARLDRQREREERRESERRTAETWPEALNKQAYLFQREANEAGDYDTDHYFADGAAACRRGNEIWREIEASKRGALAELERQIQAIRDSIRTGTAEKLMAESEGRIGWKGIAQSMIDDEDLDSFLYW